MGLFSKITLLLSIILKRYQASGGLKNAILSLIHIAQGCSISRAFMGSVSNEQKGITLWISNIINYIIKESGIEMITEYNVLALMIITPTLFFIFLIYTISDRGFAFVIKFTIFV